MGLRTSVRPLSVSAGLAGFDKLFLEEFNFLVDEGNLEQSAVKKFLA
jgi:hypothetical protein